MIKAVIDCTAVSISENEKCLVSLYAFKKIRSMIKRKYVSGSHRRRNTSLRSP